MVIYKDVQGICRDCIRRERLVEHPNDEKTQHEIKKGSGVYIGVIIGFLSGCYRVIIGLLKGYFG